MNTIWRIYFNCIKITTETSKIQYSFDIFFVTALQYSHVIRSATLVTFSGRNHFKSFAAIVRDASELSPTRPDVAGKQSRILF